MSDDEEAKNGFKGMMNLVGIRALNAVLWGLALTLCSFVLMNSSAQACRITSPVTKEMALDADTVIQGLVTNYEVFAIDRLRGARITLDVTETYQGKPQPTRSFLLWTTWIFLIPKDLADFKRTYGDEIVAGLDTNANSGFARTIDENLRQRADKSVAKELTINDLIGLPQVVQRPCAEPFFGTGKEMEPELRRLGITE